MIGRQPPVHGSRLSLRGLAAAAARHPFLACALSFALLAGATAASPQGLHFYDPVIQLLALEQHDAGSSPSWNILTRVSPEDLARSGPESIGWWPPSTQLGVVLLRHAGFGIAHALRVLALASILAGAMGWVAWFRRFKLPSAWTLGFALLVPWLHYASEALFRYSAEALAFAVTPWMLAAAAKLHEQCARAVSRALAWGLAAGALAGACYWLKYSLFVVSLAALLSVWLHRLIGGERGRPRLLSTLPASAALLLSLAGPLSLRCMLASAASTPVGHGFGFQPWSFAFLAANPALAAADASAPLFFAFVYPGLGPLATGRMETLALVGFLPGILFLGLLLAALRRRPADSATVVGASTLLLTAAMLLGLWLRSDVSHEARLFAPAAMGALPAALAEARFARRRFPRPARWAAAAAALAFVAVPLLFGPIYVALKIREEAPGRPGPSGLYLPVFGRGDVGPAISALRSRFDERSVWVLADPEAALELQDRWILLFAGRNIGEEMQNISLHTFTLGRWRSSRSLRLLVLLPRSWGIVAPPRELERTRRVRSWKRNLIAGSDLVLWEGEFEPGR